MNYYTKLAKLAVDKHIKEGKTVNPPKGLPSYFFLRKAGSFITIEQNGKLRGCIGTYLPTKKNIAEEIIQNAISAATQDFRFSQIKNGDLEQLSYSVYILDKLKKIKDISELDPIKYGILVKSDKGKTGLLLPNLEGLNTPEKQYGAVCDKCGIILGEEETILYRFKAKKYE
jgi:AmmeMemoRadiSam system protein A